MVKCLDCGLRGSMSDRVKFMQHGYPKDGVIRLSCMNCKSENLTNTFLENFVYCLEWLILIVIFFPLWFIAIFKVVQWRKSNNG